MIKTKSKPFIVDFMAECCFIIAAAVTFISELFHFNGLPIQPYLFNFEYWLIYFTQYGGEIYGNVFDLLGYIGKLEFGLSAWVILYTLLLLWLGLITIPQLRHKWYLALPVLLALMANEIFINRFFMSLIHFHFRYNGLWNILFFILLFWDSGTAGIIWRGIKILFQKVKNKIKTLGRTDIVVVPGEVVEEISGETCEVASDADNDKVYNKLHKRKRLPALWAALTMGLIFTSAYTALFIASSGRVTYKDNGDGIITGSDGTVYVKFIREGERSEYGGYVEWYGLGEFAGRIRGSSILENFEYSGFMKFGMYYAKGDPDHEILIRKQWNISEWMTIYIRSDLTPASGEPKKTERLEFLTCDTDYDPDNYYLYPLLYHADCGEGITDPAFIIKFFRDLETAACIDDTDIKERCTNENGWYINVTVCGTIVRHPKGTKAYVYAYPVYDWNGLAFTINIGGKDVVIPENWVKQLNLCRAKGMGHIKYMGKIK